MALVVGINAYDHFKGLVQAVPDASSLGAMLKEKANFTVSAVMDPATGAELRAQIDRFIRSLQPGDTVVVYYAGHGIQSQGRNYLVPADLPADESSLQKMGVAVDALLGEIARKSPALTVLMLDACRNNPLGGGTSGLASMASTAIGPNTWIEFAAEPNRTAEDGAFMRQLLAELPKPGLSLSDLFQRVRGNLAQASKGEQRPLSTNNVTINFYFIAAPETARNDSSMATLERIAQAMPRGDAGQKNAVETIIQSGQSLSATTLLQGLSLTSARLDGGQLSAARMMGTDLTGASMKGIDLSSANLAMAILNRATAPDAALDGAGLSFVDADSIDLTAARAAGTNWFAARVPKGIFKDAQLQRAGFMFANLRGANFDGARLNGAVFVGSDLTGATFEGATLDNTDFTGSIMNGVKLTAAQMKQACETRREGTATGAAGERISVTIMEVIPNPRMDGGQEYRSFFGKTYHYNLETNGLPACRPREFKDDVWFPIWRSRFGEHIRSDAGLRVSQKFLDQAGRRSAVVDRIEQHFEWLWKALEGK